MLGACGNPYYNGPITDHFDGQRFYAPEPIEKKNWFSVLKWRLTAERKKFPDWVEIIPDKPPAKVDDTELRASFVNHATILLQTRGMNILTDPIWSMRCSPLSFIGPKRVNAPGITWEDLPKIDVVLISHSHYDHLDLPTVKNLVAQDNPLFIVPLGVDTIILKAAPSANVIALDWGQNHHYNDLVVHAEPTQHWSARMPFDNSKTLWASYVLSFGNENIYFSGDTGYASGQIFKNIGQKYGKFRFALLAIGAYEPRWFMKESHMNPDETVKVYQDINADYAMGIHFGTFQLTDEGRDEPPEALQKAVTNAGISQDHFRALQPGSSWVIPK